MLLMVQETLHTFNLHITEHVSYNACQDVGNINLVTKNLIECRLCQKENFLNEIKFLIFCKIR